MHVVVYDISLKRPGCALLQAACGATVSATLFPNDCWLLAPTPEMKPYLVTDEQLEQLIAFHRQKGETPCK